MQKQIKRYTIYACLIISFATYSFSLKSANDLVKEYQESMAIVSDYMVRTAHASEPQEASHEVLKASGVEWSFEESESVIIKAKPDSIEGKIRAIFGEDSDDAILIAKCESSLDPSRIGDKHLTYTHEGKQYGDSISLFQIRTFPNRPDREQLKDVDFNIKYAKKMFDSQGWYPWTCAKTVGLIK